MIVTSVLLIMHDATDAAAARAHGFVNMQSIYMKYPTLVVPLVL